MVVLISKMVSEKGKGDAPGFRLSRHPVHLFCFVFKEKVCSTAADTTLMFALAPVKIRTGMSRDHAGNLT